MSPVPLKLGRLELSLPEKPSKPDHGHAVVQVILMDGREFSLLSATPSWFRQAFDTFGLKYYFGPGILFLAKLDKALAKKAVLEMLEDGDQWMCRYDTPRKTLPEVLAEFKARHP